LSTALIDGLYDGVLDGYPKEIVTSKKWRYCYYEPIQSKKGQPQDIVVDLLHLKPVIRFDVFVIYSIGKS
jgi:hypothetical protein